MERETHRDRETRGGAGRQPGPAAPAPAPVRRGQCGAQADGAIRPRQLLTPRQAQGPAWGAGGVRAPPAPRGPRSTAPWSPRPPPHPSPPHLCWGPRCPRVLRPAARGAPSTPARSQPFQPPAVRRSGPLAQLPGRPRRNRLLRARRLLPGPFRPVSDCRASVTASLAAASGRAALDTGARGQLCPPALAFRGRFGHSEASHFYTF